MYDLFNFKKFLLFRIKKTNMLIFCFKKKITLHLIKKKILNKLLCIIKIISKINQKNHNCVNKHNILRNIQKKYDELFCHF